MDIVNIVSTLGFPIAAVIACGWFIWMMEKSHREDIKDRIVQANAREARLMEQLSNFNSTFLKLNETLNLINNKLDIEIVTDEKINNLCRFRQELNKTLDTIDKKTEGETNK